MKNTINQKPLYSEFQIRIAIEKRIRKMKSNGWTMENLLIYLGDTGNDGGEHFTNYIKSLFI